MLTYETFNKCWTKNTKNYISDILNALFYNKFLIEFQQAVKRIHKPKNRNYNPQSLQNAYFEVMEKGMPALKASHDKH